MENSHADRLLIKKSNVIHAVTENFLHAEIPVSSENAPKPGDLIIVSAKEPLRQKILSNSESDLSAEFVSFIR